MSDLITALRTFIRLADTRSFSALAAELNASHTTIARRMDALEQHFGATLLLRTTRRLTLTDEGERLMDHAATILAALELAETDFGRRRGEPRGVVRVGVTTALGLFYAARLAPLQATHPGLTLEFAVADWPPDMAREGLDLAFRVGEVAEDALVLHPLGPVRRVVVAAPDYLTRHGALAAPERLADHACVLYGYGPASIAWPIDGVSWPVTGRFKADSSEAVRRAVVSGLGVGLLPEILVAEDIAEGRLRVLIDGGRIAPLRISIVHPARGRLPPRVRVALDFLKATFPRAAV